MFFLAISVAAAAAAAAAAAVSEGEDEGSDRSPPALTSVFFEPRRVGMQSKCVRVTFFPSSPHPPRSLYVNCVSFLFPLPV